MDDQDNLAFQYDVVDGPVGLMEVLDTYLTKSQNDASFAKVGHYVLYTLGEQRSLIRVDTSEMPFHFGYCDLFGRAATAGVKETIARFLWEKCGEKERYMRESGMKEQS